MSYPAVGLLWLVAAAVAGAAGLVAALRPPFPQLVLASLTIALLATWRLLPSFKNWVDGLTWKQLVSLHLSRFVGLYFLWCYSQGLLPFDFAVPGGLGDITVALAAVVLLLRPDFVDRSPKILFMWNTIGLLDILMVVATAAKLAVADPGSMAYLLVLPLSLLPTFLVPLIIASHVVIFIRPRTQPR